jgi:oligopeptidase B
VKGVEYGSAHHGEHFYILSNENALNFALWRAPVAHLDRESWEPVLPHRDDTKLDGVDLFGGHMAVWERRGGLEHLRVIEMGPPSSSRGGAAAVAIGSEAHRDPVPRFARDDAPGHYVEFDEPVYTIGRGGNPEFDTTTLRFVYTSPVTPSQVVDYDMATRTRTVRKEQPVLGGYDRSLYRTERIQATAADGARIPVSLVYRLPFERDGSRPMLLQGYGAYGISSDMGFSSARLSLLDRGITVAVAHVRGGEENGRHWYESGKLFNKTNSFTDFVAAAEQLVNERYTSSERLAIMGGSAGGLLMGAVVNLRPELFRAVVADVPFVDVVNTMLDPTLPLTVIEYDEWGDPNDPEVYRYILRYSPYDNVSPQPYPAMLVTGGLNDPRVGFWEPAKWVAKLRTMNTGDRPILLKTNMGAGHGGASGRYDYLREVALEYGFVISEIT